MKIKPLTKYNYIMRMKNESPREMANEMLELGITKNQKAMEMIYAWKYKFEKGGLRSLTDERGRGPKKERKHKIRIEDITQEELDILIDIADGKYDVLPKWQKFNIIHSKKSVTSIASLCKLFNVTRQGYYKWVREGMKCSYNYDKNILEIIKETFHSKNGVYGCRRLSVEILRQHGLKIHYHTIARYMKALGLKTKIRQRRKSTEAKNLKFHSKDLIQRRFKSNTKHRKLYADISYIKLDNGFGYLSAIIDGYNNEIVDWCFDLSRSTSFKFNTINTIKKIGDNSIIHTDHGTEYTTHWYLKLLKENNIKQSMGRISNSLDNRPIEYFFSILKQEYLKDYLGKVNFTEMNKLISLAMYDYNNIRFQGCLENKTPREYVTFGSDL